MGWVKLDDGFFRNQKVVGISKDAKFLYVNALCYCGANLTDGRIPKGAIRIIAAEIEARNPERLARELVGAGLWISQNDGSFLVHDYLSFNESSDKRRAKQDAAKARMKDVRSRNVRANEMRTGDDVREKLAQLETEEEIDSTEVTDVTSGADAPDATADPVKADPPKTKDTPPPAPGSRPDRPDWKPSGPDQELVAWWADYSGAGMPGMFGKAVGAAAHLRKAGLNPDDAPALFDFCAAFMTGVTLEKMAGQYDAWRQSLAKSKSTTRPVKAGPSGREPITVEAVQAEIERRKLEREQRDAAVRAPSGPPPMAVAPGGSRS